MQGVEYCHGGRKRGGRTAMKKQRAVGDILPWVSPIGVVAARYDGKIVLPRVRTRNLHEVTNKMKCVLHLKKKKKKREKKKKKRKEKK